MPKCFIISNTAENFMAIKEMLGKLRGIEQRISEKLIAPPTPPLPLPEGISERQLRDFVTSVRVSNAPETEMKAYGTHDFKRFVYTLGLTHGITGKCLELGANPYFTTMLLQQFTELELSLANFFSESMTKGQHAQEVTFRDLQTGQQRSLNFSFEHFNVETDCFPYPDNTFDVVIFAEIIEHLLNDPCSVLREIHRVLKPEGKIILTTPNVARLENVARLIAGENIYDPYSGYGPYGRHNREYNRHELVHLLQFEGFVPEEHFTADVHRNHAAAFTSLNQVVSLIAHRQLDLGQYIFIRARKEQSTRTKRPSWLYRSYPANELV
jgi:SAM-dependent methyltransferase